MMMMMMTIMIMMRNRAGQSLSRRVLVLFSFSQNVSGGCKASFARSVLIHADVVAQPRRKRRSQHYWIRMKSSSVILIRVPGRPVMPRTFDMREFRINNHENGMWHVRYAVCSMQQD